MAVFVLYSIKLVKPVAYVQNPNGIIGRSSKRGYGTQQLGYLVGIVPTLAGKIFEKEYILAELETTK